jgi:DICT domain-containing protein
MTTLTIEINQKSKKGKAFMALNREFFEEGTDVKLVDSDDKALLDEISPYNPEFVKMVLDAQKSKNRTTIDPNDIWGSLGLK